jgi:hypothetical protein
MFEIINVEVVAPLYLPPLLILEKPLPSLTCHWYVKGILPVAVTWKVAEPPALAKASVGWAVISVGCNR